MKPDAFTLRRLSKFVDDYREQKGQLATLRDLEGAGFPKAVVDAAVKHKTVQELYVTLTDGSVRKGYKTVTP